MGQLSGAVVCLNLTKVGLKFMYIFTVNLFNYRLNWTKVGLKLFITP